MTTIEIVLPDGVALCARQAGLLSDLAIRQLLEEAMRRQAGQSLLKAARNIHEANVLPMPIDELNAEVKAYRAACRGSTGNNIDPGCP